MRHCLIGSLLLAAVIVMQCAANPTYLRPGTPEVGGVKHLCLIYHGIKQRVAWTPEAILPYVAHVDKTGKPTDWMFDSFLFIEFRGPNDIWFHSYREGKPQATAADWAWLADGWFRETTGLIGLEKAVAKAGEVLKQPDHMVNVVITLPIPLRPVKEFGPLASQNHKLDFSKEADQLTALQWYIDRVLDRWHKADYRHLKLVGFYWTAEEISPEYKAVVKSTAAYIHNNGYKLFWIPWFDAPGISEWREFGIDAMMLQPNYFFPEKIGANRLAKAARKALAAGCGIEIEFDRRALETQERQDRYWAYLDAGVQYKWMKNALLGYYAGGDCLKRFVESPDGVHREMYDALYRFLKGTYQPSSRMELEELDKDPAPGCT